MVVPSRKASLPYVVLEAAAARQPLVATNVGGIPESFGPEAGRLIAPGDPDLLAQAIEEALGAAPGELARRAEALASHVQQRFSVEAMVEGVLAAYRDALAGHPQPAPHARPIPAS